MNLSAKFDIFGIQISPIGFNEAANKITELVLNGKNGYVCVVNADSTVRAHSNFEFKQVLNSADMATADGVSVVWALRLLGAKGAMQACGPELMPLVCKLAAEKNIPIGLYGSTVETLSLLKDKLVSSFPALRIVYSYSPPFRQLTKTEEQKISDDINSSGAKLLFVGLGCPRQEEWMFAHREDIKPVMLGVGAAFNFIAGNKKRAPVWMQCSGLEWLFRLFQEPRRLLKRYLVGNSIFAFLFVKEFFSRKILRVNRDV